MTNEWRDNRQYVIHAIENLQNEQKILSDQLMNIKVDAAILKTKILIWGSTASVIGAVLGSAVVGLVMHYLKIR